MPSLLQACRRLGPLEHTRCQAGEELSVDMDQHSEVALHDQRQLPINAEFKRIQEITSVAPQVHHQVLILIQEAD